MCEMNIGTEKHCTSSQMHHAGVHLPDIFQPPWAFHSGKPSLLRLVERICKQSEQEGNRKTPVSNMRVKHTVGVGWGVSAKTSSPTTQICRTLTKAHWISWMLGRDLSRSDLNTSLRCGWLFVMAVKTLRQHRACKHHTLLKVAS